MTELFGPFVLQGYDSFEGEYYDMWPLEDHTYDTMDEALQGAGGKWQEIQNAQTTVTSGELQDKLFIVALNGIKKLVQQSI